MRKVALLALFVGLSMTACARSYYVPPPPPPPRAYVGVPPAPGLVYMQGFWDLRGNRWLWVPGRWVRPPRPQALWVPGYWAPHGRAWRWRAGYWR